MPDENGTEATRSNGPSVDESLFGDAADAPAAPAAAEEDSNGENAEDRQGSDDAEEKDVGDETEASEDLKVVVSIRGGRATIGVQRPSSDPHIESFEDPDLSGLTQEALAVVERARARWEDEPKYPAHERPAPPPRRRPRREQGTAQAEAAEEGAEQPQPAQPCMSMFKNYFAAYDIAAFTEVDTFKDHMDDMLRALRTTGPAPPATSASSTRGCRSVRRCWSGGPTASPSTARSSTGSTPPPTSCRSRGSAGREAAP